MNKKFVFFVLFIFLIIVIGLIFGIFTIYRFSIVQDISRKIEDNLKKDNYHMLTSVTDFDGNTTKTEAFYRDDVGKLIASNGVYTWADGEFAYMIDEEKKEAFILNIKNENIGLVSYDMFATVIPGYKSTIWNKLLIAGNYKNTIKKTKLENRDCFIIKIVEDSIPVDKMCVMVQKEVGDRFKAVPGTKDYGSLSVYINYYFSVRKLLDNSRG